MWAVAGLLAIVATVAIVTLWFKEPTPPVVASPAGTRAVLGITAAQSNVGFLRVLVYPWASVEIDGHTVGTTPFAVPLTLPPGKHRVRLTNPYFEPIEKEVAIDRGATAILTEALQRRTTTPIGESGHSR